MKELYKGHAENLKKASQLGKLALLKQKESRIGEWNSKPKLCKNCKVGLSYDKRYNSFCGSKCAASFNNKGRDVSESHKKKTSNSLKEFYSDGQNLNKIKIATIAQNERIKIAQNEREVEYYKTPKKCKICGNNLLYEYRHRKTCSQKCRVHASTKNRTYQNGSRKPVWYFNRNENKEVLLESSWEVRIAKHLDELNVVWVRPDPIEWNDEGVNRLYYPDFYIPQYDVYLDPKNPYCMKLDEHKMREVSKKITIIYGDVSIIEEYIINLK